MSSSCQQWQLLCSENSRENPCWIIDGLLCPFFSYSWQNLGTC
jgi:hypothetical protein